MCRVYLTSGRELVVNETVGEVEEFVTVCRLAASTGQSPFFRLNVGDEAPSLHSPIRVRYSAVEAIR